MKNQKQINIKLPFTIHHTLSK